MRRNYPARLRGGLTFLMILRCLSLQVLWCLSLQGQVSEAYIFRSATRIQASENFLSWPLFPYTAGSQIRTANPAHHGGGFLLFPYGEFLALSRETGTWGTISTSGRQEGLLHAYPQGEYTFSLYGGIGGTVEFSAELGGGKAPNNGPGVSNYAALQEIDPGGPVTVEWDPEPQLPENVRVEVELFEVPEDGLERSVYRISGIDPQAPHPGTGNLVIPAGQFSEGRRYRLQLRFAEAELASQQENVPEGAVVYTVNRSETVLDLGLASDTPLDPAFSWQIDFDINWSTSGAWFLEAPHRFPRSMTVQLLIEPKDWTDVPPEQVSVVGPAGSGFEHANGWRLLYLDEAAAYAINSNSIRFPVPGAYTVNYRGKDYPWNADEVPAAANTWLAHPRAWLDGEGRLARLTWNYRYSESGASAENAVSQTMLRQRIQFSGADGWPLLEPEEVPPGQRELVIPEENRPAWKDVGRVAIASAFDGGRRSVANYGLLHAERPSMVYFNSGTPVGNWLEVDWFGWITERDWPWVWHEGHGFLYLAGEGDGPCLALDPRLGWLYFSPQTYPWIYAHRTGTWLYYLAGTRWPERWFYHSVGSAGGWLPESSL